MIADQWLPPPANFLKDSDFRTFAVPPLDYSVPAGILPRVSTRTPCSDYVEVRGAVFFARMLDKIRLRAAGELPPNYNLGDTSPTSFDARFCRFWEVDYARLVARTLQGGSDEEVFDAVIGPTPNPERVLVWNGFLLKRGWRDETSAGLAQDKQAAGFGDRDDIQTFVDFHDADEGRTPRRA